MLIRLFGSRANGCHRPASDIDIAIDDLGDDISEELSVLKRYSIEQGGPLDVFTISSVDDSHALIALFSETTPRRSVVLGDDCDLNEWYDQCRVIEFDELIALCRSVAAAWSQVAQTDRINDKVVAATRRSRL